MRTKTTSKYGPNHKYKRPQYVVVDPRCHIEMVDSWRKAARLMGVNRPIPRELQKSRCVSVVVPVLGTFQVWRV